MNEITKEINVAQEEINFICKAHKLPPVEFASICYVEGKRGKIIGGNGILSFLVVFDDLVDVSEFIPVFETQIYDKNTKTLIYESPDYEEVKQ